MNANNNKHVHTCRVSVDVGAHHRGLQEHVRTPPHRSTPHPQYLESYTREARFLTRRRSLFRIVHARGAIPNERRRSLFRIVHTRGAILNKMGPTQLLRDAVPPAGSLQMQVVTLGYTVP